MKYPMFAIRDKATCFMPPVADQTEQSAIRNFSQAVSTGNLNFEPADFDLYKVGYFDDQNGELTHIVPEWITNGVNVLKRFDNEV